MSTTQGHLTWEVLMQSMPENHLYLVFKNLKCCKKIELSKDMLIRSNLLCIQVMESLLFISRAVRLLQAPTSL